MPAHALRSITACTLTAALLTACASAAPAPQAAQELEKLRAELAAAKAQDESTRGRLAAERAAALATIQAEKERAVEAELAAKKGDPLAGLESVVVPVSGYADKLAGAIRESLMCTVTATPLGNSVVLTGEPKRVKAATELLVQLSERASADLDREHAELRRQEELHMLEQQRRIAASDRVFDVELGGTLEGSLTSISEALNNVGGQGLNVVIANPEDAKLPVRSVQLQRVSLGAALRTIESLQVDPQYGPQIRIEVGRSNNPEERPVVTVTATPSARSASEEGRRHVAVFRLDALNDVSDADDRARVEKQNKSLLDAIQVGLDVAGASPDFKIKLHPDTGMMFVNGTRSQVRIVAEVLGQEDPLAPNPFNGAARGITPAPPAPTTTPAATVLAPARGNSINTTTPAPAAR